MATVCVKAQRNLTELFFQKWLDGDLDLDDDDPSTGSSSLAPILEAMVKYSPVEPVAGNPNALDSRMLYADFRMAMAAGVIGLAMWALVGKHPRGVLLGPSS